MTRNNLTEQSRGNWVPSDSGSKSAKSSLFLVHSHWFYESDFSLLHYSWHFSHSMGGWKHRLKEKAANGEEYFYLWRGPNWQLNFKLKFLAQRWYIRWSSISFFLLNISHTERPCIDVNLFEDSELEIMGGRMGDQMEKHFCTKLLNVIAQFIICSTMVMMVGSAGSEDGLITMGDVKRKRVQEVNVWKWNRKS